MLVAINNLSGLPTDVSDGLCRLSTGRGFGTRALHTDDPERAFDQQRPVVLNGLAAIATHQDLLDRSIVIRLPRLQALREEVVLWEDFKSARSVILAGLLDAVAGGLQRLDGVPVSGEHRMADFTRWIAAAVPTLGWSPEDVIAAYKANQDASQRMSLDGDQIATAIENLMDQLRSSDRSDHICEGRPTQLIEARDHISPTVSGSAIAGPATRRRSAAGSRCCPRATARRHRDRVDDHPPGIDEGALDHHHAGGGAGDAGDATGRRHVTASAGRSTGT